MARREVTDAGRRDASGQCVIVQGVSWDTYACLLADFADSSGTRMAYDRGTLEIMAPSFKHEQAADFLADIVKAVAEAQGLEFVTAGSTTFKREDVERGFELDASFYLQHAADVRRRATIDLAVDPLPDVIIGIDLTHPSSDKFPIYAPLGVPEVWRYDGQQMHIYRRADDAASSSRLRRRAPLAAGTTRPTGRLAWARQHLRYERP